jgi:hypothetical protein
MLGYLLGSELNDKLLEISWVNFKVSFIFRIMLIVILANKQRVLGGIRQPYHPSHQKCETRDCYSRKSNNTLVKGGDNTSQKISS